MSWNYRVCTQIYSYKDKFPGNKRLSEKEDARLFSIHEFYYDKDGVPTGIHQSPTSLSDWENIEDLQETVDLIQSAFKKPTMDLDNFPNEFKEK